jgi:hypothetical protein
VGLEAPGGPKSSWGDMSFYSPTSPWVCPSLPQSPWVLIGPCGCTSGLLREPLEGARGSLGVRRLPWEAGVTASAC